MSVGGERRLWRSSRGERHGVGPRRVGALADPATSSSPASIAPLARPWATLAHSSSSQRRSYAIPCNLRLGADPPKPVIVRYGPGLADAFIELADDLEETVPGLVVTGEEENEEGAFRVLSPAGAVVWCARAVGRRPTAADLRAQLAGAVGEGAEGDGVGCGR